MTETLIEAIIRLFAIITDTRNEAQSGKGNRLVLSFLKENFNKELTDKYVALYNQYLDLYHRKFKGSLIGRTPSEKRRNRSFTFNVCEKIVADYELSDRILMAIYLLDFVKNNGELGNDNIEFVKVVAEFLKIDADEFADIESFILFDTSKIKHKDRVCIINGEEDFSQPPFKHIYNANQLVRIVVYRILSVNMFIFRYTGPRNMYINGHKVQQGRTYVLNAGSVIKTSRVRPIYYGAILSQFTTQEGISKIAFSATNVSYKFGKRKYGVHEFSFAEESGHLVGIMGGSGSGKSTLLNVLNGSLKLASGQIKINGYNLHDLHDREHLKGVIGYVPQDDMLIEDLTVYDNLWFNAKMCFSKSTDAEIKSVVDKSLVNFDLLEAKDLKVGSPLRKIISGGQRKRLNIALELMREPSILFVDEPTSGLSSADSEKVMNLLKRQTFNGKLVFTVIHQPSSDIFKMLDRVIMMDQGGYVIYNGNPIAAISYFKDQAHFINADVTECSTCGNIKSDQPLRIIEARMVNPNGRFIRKRKKDPIEWHHLYHDNFDREIIHDLEEIKDNKKELPPLKLKIPNRKKQFKLYTMRDLRVKLSNAQYLLITLLQAPLLAVVLSLFTRYNAGNESDPNAYVFAENVNILAYFFMSILVSLFLGLIQSAEEIFREKNILKRESFLNLSRLSFMSSKVFILFSMSAFQMLLYTIIGNAILGIHGMTFHLWLILFSTSCFANMLGLNLSSGLNSAVAIYIVIPLMLIPQILFSGTVVDFKKLPKFASTPIYAPIMGDIMASRWAFEAAMVFQYKHNEYNRKFFKYELERQHYVFLHNFLLPNLEKRVNAIKKGNNAAIVINELEHVRQTEPHFPFFARLPEYYDLEQQQANHYLDTLTQYASEKLQLVNGTKNQKITALSEAMGGIKQLLYLKDKHVNNRIKETLEKPFENSKTLLYHNRLYRNDKPIYVIPEHRFGRAHFYSPYKRLGNVLVPTFLFNVTVIWFSTLLLWILLYYKLFSKAVHFFENRRKRLRKDE